MKGRATPTLRLLLAGRATCARARAGVSLLEVLIAIFVLTVGLMGIAAIIPVGGHEIAQAVTADHAGACGQHGLKEVKIRGMLDPRAWRSASGPVVVRDLPTGRLGLRLSEDPVDESYYLSSFAIDPLYIARNAADAAIEHFPNYPDPGDTSVESTMSFRMERVTLTGPGSAALQEALFDRIFTWHDDLRIPVPKDDSERPRQMVLYDTGEGAAFPPLPGQTSPSGNRLLAQIAGDYTWMITVTPSPEPAEQYNVDTDEDGDADTQVWAHEFENRTFSVSIVVFYKRDFTSPDDYDLTAEPPKKLGERAATANLLSDGWGGGDVRLTVPDATFALHPEYFDVRENQWLMLCGRSGVRKFFRWYRIVAVGGEPEELVDAAGNRYWERLVTLAGPDWNTGDPGAASDFGWCTGVDSDADGVPHEVQAALFHGVVGVYTTTVELE